MQAHLRVNAAVLQRLGVLARRFPRLTIITPAMCHVSGSVCEDGLAS